MLVLGMAWDHVHGILVLTAAALYNLSGRHVEPSAVLASLYAVRDTGYLLIVLLAFRYLMRERPTAELGIRPFPWWQAVLGAAVGLVYMELAPLLALALHMHPSAVEQMNFHIERTARGLSAAAFLVSIAIISPIAQEAYFRAVLLRTFTAYMPVWGSLVAASLIFAAWHHTGGMRQMSDTFVFGLVSGMLYLRTRNLAAPCAMHIVVNAHAELFNLGVLR